MKETKWIQFDTHTFMLWINANLFALCCGCSRQAQAIFIDLNLFTINGLSSVILFFSPTLSFHSLSLSFHRSWFPIFILYHFSCMVLLKRWFIFNSYCYEFYQVDTNLNGIFYILLDYIKLFFFFAVYRKLSCTRTNHD